LIARVTFCIPQVPEKEGITGSTGSKLQQQVHGRVKSVQGNADMNGADHLRPEYAQKVDSDQE
jgi:hypothetical protein